MSADLDMLTAYFAGFFDGEGSIDIRFETKTHKSGKVYERFYLRVNVVQVDRKPLDMMCARWGGSVARRKNNSCHAWVATTRSAAEFLRDIAPYLIVKREEADIAVAFQATMRTKLVNTAGSKGVDRLDPALRRQRYDLMIALRDVRFRKGTFARSRAHVPTERLH